MDFFLIMTLWNIVHISENDMVIKNRSRITLKNSKINIPTGVVRELSLLLLLERGDKKPSSLNVIYYAK